MVAAVVMSVMIGGFAQLGDGGVVLYSIIHHSRLGLKVFFSVVFYNSRH